MKLKDLNAGVPKIMVPDDWTPDVRFIDIDFPPAHWAEHSGAIKAAHSVHQARPMAADTSVASREPA